MSALQSRPAGFVPNAPEQVDCNKINRSHTQQHDKNNTTNKQSHERTTPTPHSTTLKGGATTVRTTTHARVGGRAEVSVGGRVEVRRALGRTGRGVNGGCE